MSEIFVSFKQCRQIKQSREETVLVVMSVFDPKLMSRLISKGKQDVAVYERRVHEAE